MFRLKDMSYPLGRDTIVNIVLQQSYEDIVDLLNVDQVASLLFSWGRITLPELDQLQNMGIFTDQKRRRHFLYSVALADKGQEGLGALLKALCETAGEYEPHALLLDKLYSKLKAHGISPSTGTFTRSVTNASAMESSQEVVS